MLKLWTTHLFDRLDDPLTKQIVVTVGQAQHIAQLEFPMPTTGDTQYRSAGCKSGDVNEAMFLLSDDLKGPSTLNPTELRDRKLRLYRGQPVLIYADIAEFTLNFPLPAPEPQYCSVRFIKDLED